MTEKELHLIDKSALVAEIKKRIKGLKDCHADTVAGYAGEISGLERLLSFIDTIETKEVDFTDAFIEKACEWLKKNRKNYSSNALGEEYLIDDFKKAMKGD